MNDERLDIILRGIGNAVTTHLAPEATSALGKDAATFGAGLLRGVLLDRQATQRIADYESALHKPAAAILGDKISRDAIGAWIETLGTNPENTEQFAALLATVANEEKRLQTGIRADDEAENQRAKTMAAATEETVTAESICAYLNRKLSRNDIAVTALHTIPGGGSKITRYISLAPIAGLPGELIMRQDYAVNHVGNSIVDEYPFLEALHRAGLPIAAPVLLEARHSTLGAPFMLVQKLEGRNIGNLWGFFPDTDPEPVCFELARVLAQIHSLPADSIAVPGAEKMLSLRERVALQIDEIHCKWKRGRISTSPVIALALLWLRQQLDTGDVAPTLVHGDCAFTNILVHEGRISALLDWEFAHIGDPAEDLAYIRSVVQQVVPWEAYVDAYCAAGGKAPSEARLHYFDVWRALRNAIYAGLAGESFLRGDTSYVMLGWAGVYAEPLLEHQIMQLIGDAWTANDPA